MPTEKTRSHHRPGGMNLIYEDRDILVVDKPSGLLTMGTERDKTRTAYCLATDYVRKGNPKARQRLFIVHRLDRDTSGLLLFAKSEAAQKSLQGRWDDTQKRYLAIVHGHLASKKGTISTYLAENQAHNVYSTSDPRLGKLSHTAYTVLQEEKTFTLVEIDLLTGRKNQIRVHFAEIGHPLVGDRKYGMGQDGQPRLALHAKAIAFPHPFDGRPMAFAADVPEHFARLLGKVGRQACSTGSR